MFIDTEFPIFYLCIKTSGGTLMNNRVKELQPSDGIYIYRGSCDRIDQQNQGYPFVATVPKTNA